MHNWPTILIESPICQELQQIPLHTKENYLWLFTDWLQMVFTFTEWWKQRYCMLNVFQEEHYRLPALFFHHTNSMLTNCLSTNVLSFMTQYIWCFKIIAGIFPWNLFNGTIDLRNNMAAWVSLGTSKSVKKKEQKCHYFFIWTFCIVLKRW